MRPIPVLGKLRFCDTAANRLIAAKEQAGCAGALPLPAYVTLTPVLSVWGLPCLPCLQRLSWS